MATTYVDDMHQDMHEGSTYRRIELITGRRSRRNWSDDEKATIVAASSEPGINISDVARRFGVSRGLLSVWRRQAGLGLGSTRRVEPFFVPITTVDRPVNGVGGKQEPVTDVNARPGPPGRIEIEVGGGRMILTGSVDPDLASAIVAALRGKR